MKSDWSRFGGETQRDGNLGKESFFWPNHVKSHVMIITLSHCHSDEDEEETNSLRF